MKQVQVTTLTPTSAILLAMLQLTGILTKRMLTAILRTMLAVKTWLNTRHEFGFPEDPNDPSESVKMTGWQYLGFGLLTSVFALLLSIDWESVI